MLVSKLLEQRNSNTLGNSGNSVNLLLEQFSTCIRYRLVILDKRLNEQFNMIILGILLSLIRRLNEQSNSSTLYNLGNLVNLFLEQSNLLT